jgi:hypothetical protein
VLSGRERHELSCAACGAPLHDMKMLRVDRGGERDLVPASRARPETPANHRAERIRRPAKPRKIKRKYKPLGGFKRLFEEAFDVIEDIFD